MGTIITSMIPLQLLIGLGERGCARQIKFYWLCPIHHLLHKWKQRLSGIIVMQLFTVLNYSSCWRRIQSAPSLRYVFFCSPFSLSSVQPFVTPSNQSPAIIKVGVFQGQRSLFPCCIDCSSDSPLHQFTRLSRKLNVFAGGWKHRD